MALALSLGLEFPHRDLILAMTFGVVAFSIVVQGLSMKPLLRALGLVEAKEHAYDQLKVRQAALSYARSELDQLLAAHSITAPVHERLRGELGAKLEQVASEITAVQQRDPALAEDELRLAERHLITAQKSAIQRAAGEGLIAVHLADAMIESAEQRLDELKADAGED